MAMTGDLNSNLPWLEKISRKIMIGLVQYLIRDSTTAAQLSRFALKQYF